MQVFGQFELVISIFSVGLLNTKGDMQALSSLSLNCSNHKLTQPLINLPMASILWLVSRIRLPGTLTDSNVLLQRLRLILAVVNSLGHGLLVLALASQNTWNAPSEIIPSWDLKNDLHDICPKLKFPANCVVSIRHVCFPWDLQIQCACVTLCRDVLVQCMFVLHGNSTIATTPKSSYGRPVSQK